MPNCEHLLDRGITPVVVEVPEYGIEEFPAVGLLSWGKRAIYLRRAIYLQLFDSGKVDVILDYRKALRDRIPPDVNEKVTFVEFTSIADDYNRNKSLYANHSHLNKDGYEKLGRLIAERIKDSHIGIGSLLAETPFHTTGHAGPHPAIRLIKAYHQLSRYNPRDLK